MTRPLPSVHPVCMSVSGLHKAQTSGDPRQRDPCEVSRIQ